MKRIIAAAVVIASVSVTAMAVLPAQTRDADAGTSRELAAEIRALRLAIERHMENQTQTQTLGSLMTVQQQRIAEANARLDLVRRELDGTTTRYNEVARQLAAVEQVSPGDITGSGGTPQAARRLALEEQQSQLRHDFETVSAQVAQLRARESEALNQVTFEEGRWREFTGRMEQLLKR